MTLDIVRRVQGGQFEHVGKTPRSSLAKLLSIKSKLGKNKISQVLIDEQNFEDCYR